MKRLYLLLPVFFIGLLLFVVGCAEQAADPESIAKGGALYDKWWKISESASEPSGDHPLWSIQSTNTRSGSSTYRCKECHGWDYQGEDGAYSKGSHFTGFPNILAAVEDKSKSQIIKDLESNDKHIVPLGLNEADLDNLADFLNEGLVDNRDYINYDTKKVIGANLANGKQLYNKSCAACHGTNGQLILIEDTESVASLANGNPWEILHKIRFGQPGTPMPSGVANGWSTQDAVDVLGYAQTLPTEIITQAKADIMAAIDLIDSTGFHGISTAIEEATTFEEVSSRTKGSVEKSITAANAIAWPTELAEAQAAFLADAEALVEALDAADLAAAKEASLSVHGTQHDFSNGTYEWLGSQVGKASGSGAVMAAIDLIDSTGFHGISTAIEEAATFEEVSSRTKGSVEKSITAANAVAWPTELAEVQAAFLADAEALVEALDAADLAASKEASLSVHGTQHDLSHETFEWLVK